MSASAVVSSEKNRIVIVYMRTVPSPGQIPGNYHDISVV